MLNLCCLVSGGCPYLLFLLSRRSYLSDFMFFYPFCIHKFFYVEVLFTWFAIIFMYCKIFHPLAPSRGRWNPLWHLCVCCSAHSWQGTRRVFQCLQLWFLSMWPKKDKTKFQSWKSKEHCDVVNHINELCFMLRNI